MEAFESLGDAAECKPIRLMVLRSLESMYGKVGQSLGLFSHQWEIGVEAVKPRMNAVGVCDVLYALLGWWWARLG